MRISWEELEEALEDDDNSGFCLDCGNRQDGCEPDARMYECEDCGRNAVYGAEEVLMMGAYDDSGDFDEGGEG